MSNETVLITGASSGIGRELAGHFARDGSDLILVARREELLEELADEMRTRYGVDAAVLPFDLSDADAPTRLFERVERDGRGVDVLVNNAGFGARGGFADLELERQLDMIRVNVTALTHLTRLFLPGMLARRRGGLLNIGSMAGYLPGPNMSVYYATKAFVLALSEGLAEEVRGTGVQVTCLTPGPTRTDFLRIAGTREARHVRAGTLSVQDVARAGYRGFRAGRVLVVPGVPMKAGVFLLRLGPRALVRRVAGFLNG